MKANAPTRLYTIRGVSEEVDRALRRTAALRRQSLNRVVVDELTRALSGQTLKADFSDLVGKWEEDPAFDEIVSSQRKIDPRKWR